MTGVSSQRRAQAWNHGEAAALAGKTEHANKQTPGTIYFDDWLDGFADGERRK